MMTTAETARALDLPASAPDILRWLAGGSRSLRELVVQRTKVLRESYPDAQQGWVDYYAPQSVLYDLNALAQVNLVHIDSEGRITKERP